MKTFTIAKPISISIDNFYIQVLPFYIIFSFLFFFDSANGYIQEFKGVHLPIGIAFRGFILCLTMKFLLKNLSTLLTLLFWIITILISMAFAIWSFTGKYIDAAMDIDYLFKFVYTFCILFYFYIRLTNKRIKRSPYSFPGSAISVFLLCKIPSERANLIFFSINSLLKHLPIYIMIRLFRQKTTLFFGNPYTTNLF